MGGARRRRWGGALAILAALATQGAACSASRAAEGEAIVRALSVEPGMTVADVGAGDGEWSIVLAERVGERGRVFATEVDEDLVGEIEERAASAGHLNIMAVLGGQDEIGVAAGCCDRILLRLVYHHFERPAAMRADLRAALKPGGLLAIVDIVPQESWRELPGVPDRGGHGIPVADLILEMEGDGFELVERFDDWNGDADRFCLVFRAAA